MTCDVLAGPQEVRPIQDWTGNGKIDVYDRLWYNIMLYNPAVGYKPWPAVPGTAVFLYNRAGSCRYCHWGM